jgi:hypothetical protein
LTDRLITGQHALFMVREEGEAAHPEIDTANVVNSQVPSMKFFCEKFPSVDLCP